MTTIQNEHIDFLLSKLNSLQVMKQCLELRLSLINQNFACLDEYDRNEKTILRIETNKKILVLDYELGQLQSDFQYEHKMYIEELQNQPKG
jgi:hypothetical protein